VVVAKVKLIEIDPDKYPFYYLIKNIQLHLQIYFNFDYLFKDERVKKQAPEVSPLKKCIIYLITMCYVYSILMFKVFINYNFDHDNKVASPGILLPG
jgi:hypothetical protein